MSICQKVKSSLWDSYLKKKVHYFKTWMLCMLSCQKMNLAHLYIKRAGCIEASSLHQLLQASFACLPLQLTATLPPKSCPLMTWGFKTWTALSGRRACLRAPLCCTALSRRPSPEEFRLHCSSPLEQKPAGRSALALRLHQFVFALKPGSDAGVTVLARFPLTDIELEIKTRDIPKIRNSFSDTFRSGQWQCSCAPPVGWIYFRRFPLANETSANGESVVIDSEAHLHICRPVITC